MSVYFVVITVLSNSKNHNKINTWFYHWETFSKKKLVTTHFSQRNLIKITTSIYLHMTLPNNIEHARRRTVNFVLGMIALVWMLSCLICLPPVFGWNDWPEDWNDETHCELSQKKGYVIYSAMGSFYIPLAIIMFVYFKIFQVCKISLKFYSIFYAIWAYQIWTCFHKNN